MGIPQYLEVVERHTGVRLELRQSNQVALRVNILTHT